MSISSFYMSRTKGNASHFINSRKDNKQIITTILWVASCDAKLLELILCHIYQRKILRK